MFFDDRLATVLRQEGSSESAQRTQFRQLLDILGNRKFGPAGRSDPSLIAAAWLRMDALGRSIPAPERAAMIREPSWRFRSADLAAHLSDFEPEVASAALNRAQLSAEDWSALIPRLPVRARGFLRLRRDLPIDAERLLDRLGVADRGLPLPAGYAGETSEDAGDAALDLVDPVEDGPDAMDRARGQSASSPTPAPPDPVETGRSEISALVERIARFKRNRDAAESDALIDSERSPRLPLGEDEPGGTRLCQGFGFSADAAGRIEWADSEIAAMVIGARLFAPQALGEADAGSRIERAFEQRQPIVNIPTQLAGAPAIAGAWVVDAQPRFTFEGHFTGFVGRFRRPPGGADAEAGKAAQEADRIRQLLHELRTPVTAVQGYAEVIQQQLFGPAPHEYRALAAAIAADAAHILAGFEELDRLARLEAGGIALEPGETDLAAIVGTTQRQLAQVLAPRMAGLEVACDTGADLTVAVCGEDAELIVWRLLATLAGACDKGEVIAASLDPDGADARLSCDLPRQLSGEEDIFAARTRPVGHAINAGVFGAGFVLRLARAEARAGGGDLVHAEGRVELTLPRAARARRTPGTAPELDRASGHQ
ncbi:MAG: histidine kinase dimerization/phospho-acceptor domain-containing protein [Erythrobacter sp.]|jgi:signal transduction histidine kinase|nr:histidine kinase dimerization/phospho-acceptor domain-containing protein [Erythrobacter sp.]